MVVLQIGWTRYNIKSFSKKKKRKKKKEKRKKKRYNIKKFIKVRIKFIY